jgi:hypothetical protein
VSAPAHYRGLEGASVVATEPLARARGALKRISAERGLGVFYGDAGYGKTFATRCAIALDNDLDVVWCVFPTRRTTQVQVIRRVLELATGVPHRGELYDLMAEAREELAVKPRLLVVDEAQELNAECVDVLRHLHDEERTDFALLFVGGNGCWEVLSRFPMLKSRLTRAIGFKPLSQGALLDYLPRFHPLYADADPTVLAWVDQNYARGSLRAWTGFTKEAVELVNDGKDLTQDTALRVLAELPPGSSS